MKSDEAAGPPVLPRPEPLDAAPPAARPAGGAADAMQVDAYLTPCERPETLNISLSWRG